MTHTKKKHKMARLDQQKDGRPCNVLGLVSVATALVVLLSVVSPASGQSDQTLNNCRRQCYFNYLSLYQYYCYSWGSSCQYYNYLAQFYTTCYKNCNDLMAPPTTAATPSTTTTTTTTAPYIQRCGVSYVSRAGGGGTVPAPVSIEGRIVNGTFANDCEFPWTVVINIGTTFCGGSILDSNTIITAGHCVYSKSAGVAKANTVYVKYGSSDQYLTKTVNVTKVTLHPSFYLDYYDYDVALLTLSSPVQYDRCTQPICLPDPNAYPNNFCQVAGWGALSYTQPSAQRNLRKVTLPMVNLQACLNAFRDARLISDIKLCAGDLVNGGIDACLGDSGGPLMCDVNGLYYLHGTVSFGRGCATPGYPGVYARLTHSGINAWIRQNMEQD